MGSARHALQGVEVALVGFGKGIQVLLCRLRVAHAFHDRLEV